MDNNLTPKQEKFCQEYVTTGNASEAYRRAYDASKSKDSTINRKAKEMLDMDKISARIGSLRSELSKKHSKTREDIIQDLTDIVEQYKLTGKFTGHTLKAIEILNKMCGFNATEKQEITIKSEQPLFGPLDMKGKKDE